MRKATTRKAQRLEEAMLKEIGEILVQEVQDPRLDMVTISGVRLNTDLSVAEVMYTHSGEESKKKEVEQGLAKASGFIRSRLGKKVKLRKIPELRFIWDQYLETMIYASFE